MEWMIYGANGYTGQLIAELAASRGHKPVLAGRSADKVRPMAEKLGLRWRAFGLEQPDLAGMALVLHCAGPFSQTSRPMVDACLAARAHYLDITGELAVFEAVLERGAEARERGVVLLPGAGFDVVPSDCLAALLKRELPSATKLELAFAPRGGMSPGTLKTSIEGLPRGGVVRREGKLVRVLPAHHMRTIPFADKVRTAMSIPWGDVATAWRSTGIPNITVFIAVRRRSAVYMARLMGIFGPLLGLWPVQKLVQAAAGRLAQGPSAAERASGRVELWGYVSDGTREVQKTMTVPEGYTFTAHSALECSLRVLRGAVKPGAWTPSLAFGAGFAQELPGVSVADVELL